MKNHRWSEDDLILLENNVKQFGIVIGSKKTSEELYVSESACMSKYYAKLHKFIKSGIKVDHPEVLKTSKVITEPKPETSKIVHEHKKYRTRMSASDEKRLAEYLKSEIGKNPNNLQEVFRKAAIEFGFKSKGSISRRWYGYRSGGGFRKDGSKYDHKDKPSYRGNIGPVFSIIGENATINGKNQDNPTVKKTSWIMTIFRKWINKK